MNNMSRVKSRRIVLWLGSSAIWLWGMFMSVLAQTPPSVWAPPQPINNECCAAYPLPIIDPWGQLHLFWADAERYIWYTRWSGEGWIQPVDVIANPGNGTATGPDVAVDTLGRFHVVWRDGGTGGALYYASVDVSQAADAHAWRSPTELAPQALGAAVAVDQTGTIYVVYTPFQAGESFSLITSRDGSAWSQPLPALSSLSSDFTGGSYVNLALDKAGSLHVAWNSQAYPGGYPEHAVFYQRSTDGGLTWSEPYDPDPLPPEVDSDTTSNFKNKMLNVAIGPAGDVHLTWHQYTGFRFHRWSNDGGVTWSEKEPVFPDMGAAYNGVVDMAFDSTGRMHIVASRGAIWYRTWSVSAGWTPPELVDPTPADWHHHRVAVVGGNEVFLFYPDINETGILWYTHKIVDAPAVATLPAPTRLIATQVPLVSTPQPALTPVPTVTVTAAKLSEQTMKMPVGQTPTLWIWALVPALLLVGAVVVARLMSMGRR
ncbi:MAG TPA: exo-alpha-sialidase [Chloroflexi bacterium]|nr:exo-alpha-sialidase [Chloroflexota bacterium]